MIPHHERHTMFVAKEFNAGQLICLGNCTMRKILLAFVISLVWSSLAFSQQTTGPIGNGTAAPSTVLSASPQTPVIPPSEERPQPGELHPSEVILPGARPAEPIPAIATPVVATPQASDNATAISPTEPTTTPENVPPTAPASTPTTVATPAPAVQPAPATTSTSTGSTEKAVGDPEAEKLEEQKFALAKVKTPEELFQFFRTAYQLKRDYKSASLIFSFAGTPYTTQSLQQECMAQWYYIIDRIDETLPREFSQNDYKEYRAERRFRTADSHLWIEFVRTEDGHWQIGPGSIAQTDEIYEDVKLDRPIKGDWLSKNVPPWMFHVFFGLSYFQWTVLCGGFLLGALVYMLAHRILYLLMRAYMHVVYKDVTRKSKNVWKQVAAIIAAYIWFKTFALVVPSPRLYTISYYVFLTFTTVLCLAIMMRIIDLLADALRIRISPRFSEAHVNNLIVPMFSRSLKVIAVCIGVVTLMQASRWPVVGILSGLGIGGMAIAFAAKETIGNFFGSITVMIDQPFEIGDWIVTDGVEGTVEAVGMRSTKIRTFYNSVITIPNNNLNTAVIDNMGRRRYRRFRTFLTMQYENGPDRIEAFCEAIKELIEKNAFTWKENYSVSIYNLQASSVDVLLNVFFICPSTATENRERARLLKNILKLAEQMDVRFAYPTQMMYVNEDSSAKFKPLPDGDSQNVGRDFATKLLYPDAPPEETN